MQSVVVAMPSAMMIAGVMSRVAMGVRMMAMMSVVAAVMPTSVMTAAVPASGEARRGNAQHCQRREQEDTILHDDLYPGRSIRDWFDP
jgi:hypothetical protein